MRESLAAGRGGEFPHRSISPTASRVLKVVAFLLGVALAAALGQGVARTMARPVPSLRFSSQGRSASRSAAGELADLAAESIGAEYARPVGETISEDGVAYAFEILLPGGLSANVAVEQMRQEVAERGGFDHLDPRDARVEFGEIGSDGASENGRCSIRVYFGT